MDTPIDRRSLRGPGARRLWFIPSIILTLVVVVAVAYWFYQSASQSPAAFGLSKKAFHAIFMSNGQAYFGKISRINDQFATIDQVYYLRKFETPLQPIAADEGATASDDKNTPDLQVVKLGGEIHGPQNRMTINRQHILFIEELKPDSRVVTTINTSDKK
ncbi:MAG: hypothetical protein HY567_02980 [Candidatus Kerfeldbacteria bacterium]|nr:hypothetical protein [Candidatus Kerfeldbacteria bacterium]